MRGMGWVGSSANLGEQCRDILRLDAGDHHALVALLPVDWGRDLQRGEEREPDGGRGKRGRGQ